MTDQDLLQALRDCYTPIHRQNLVDARLVRSATLTADTSAPGASIPGLPPRYLATVVLYSPNNDPDADAQLLAQVENRLLGLQPISRAHVTLVPALFPIL